MVKMVKVAKNKPLKTTSSTPGQFVKVTKRKSTEKYSNAFKKSRKTYIENETEEIAVKKMPELNDILNEIKYTDAEQQNITEWFEKLQKLLLDVPAQTDKQAKENRKWINKTIYLPIVGENLKPTKKAHKFYGIHSVNLIGAHAIGTATVDSAIDICIEIPKCAFDKNSHRNLDYHQIRAFHLAYVAKELDECDLAADIQFTFFNGNVFHPVIRFQAHNPETDTFLNVFIHAIGEAESIKFNRILPSVRNVDADLFTEIDAEQFKIGFSPHYNSSIGMDLSTMETCTYLNDQLGSHENIRDAIVLLKMWIKSRGFVQYGCFMGGHIITMFVAYLLEKRKINGAMDVVNILRIVWTNLSTAEWYKVDGGIYWNPNQQNVEAFHKHFDIVFIDRTGNVNICANVTTEVFKLLQDESRRALNLVQKKSIKELVNLISIEMPDHLRFDHICTISDNANISKILISKGSQEYYFDWCCADWHQSFYIMLRKILHQGLGNRICHLIPIIKSPEPWSIGSQFTKDERQFSFGLCLQPGGAALEVMDRGPAADQQAAIEFKQFWGDKSELRRFQDGAVIEACLWNSPADPLSERRLICKSIIYHLLEYHMDLSSEYLNYFAHQFDDAYKMENIPITMAIAENENCENLSLSVIKSFNELTKTIREVDGIPLEVSSILGVSPIFRYTEIEPVLPNALEHIDMNKRRIFQSYTVNEAVIQFVQSGKWPAELNAIRRVKAALLLQLAKGLRKQYKLAVIANPDNIEILKDGFVFRFYVAIHKELLLMKKQRTTNGILKYRNTKESLQYEKHIFLKTKLTLLLHNLYHQNSSFGPAVQITKRWLHSQLIDSHLWPDECTELLMAYLYTEQNMFDVPVQPQIGFFRFLHFVSTVDWMETMFVCNLGEGFEADEMIRLKTRFSAERTSFPPLCLITPADDRNYSIWSKDAPSAELLARITFLSGYALSLIKPTISSDLSKSLFIPSTNGYDVLIMLRKCYVPTCYLNDFTADHKRTKHIDQAIPPVSFNPVQLYLDELRKAYSDFAIFFYDPCGGLTIAVLWKPYTMEINEFEESAMNGKCRVGKFGNRFHVNRKQIIEDFRIIGHKLVELVTVVNE